MSIQSKKEECALSVKAPEPGENDFTETACGLARALGKVSLTPVIGAGLLGTAAHDALGTGAVGTMVKAKELIYKVQEGDAEDVQGEDEVEVGNISETVNNNKPAERAAATPIEIFDPDTCDYKYLRENYVAKGIPFILRKPNGESISNASPPRTVEDGDEGNISIITDDLNVKLDGIDEIVKKLLPTTFRAYWPLWFQGNYTSGLAHVDLGPGTCNFYWLKRGKKDVVIATPQVTRELTLETGIDNIHIPGSSGNHDYLANLEHYYRVTLEEQSVLIFNNSGCLHHFTNIIEEGVTPIALSNRCKYAYGSDPRGWIHLAGNLNVWYNMADHYVDLMADGEQARKQEKV